MGDGLAKKFKKIFQECLEPYIQACVNRQLTTGRVLVWPTGKDQPEYIIYLPTKRHWSEQSKIEYIESGLDALVQAIREHGIRSVAIPALGTGHGGLDWDQVKEVMLEKLKRTELEGVTIHIYNPEGRY